MSSSAAPIWRLRCYESLPSTSDLLIAQAVAGEPAGAAILARRQTAGRGSRGREWSAPEGNLNLSVLLRPDAPAQHCGRFALLAAVALHDAFAGCGAQGLALKWPNDVLLHGRKLAGILLDSAIDDTGKLDWIVMGLGANLAAAPQMPGRQTACLAEQCAAPTPEAFAETLLRHVGHWLTHDFESLREAWLARAQPLGTALTVSGGGQHRQGRFAGLSPDGALLLDEAGQLCTVATGDILLAAG